MSFPKEPEQLREHSGTYVIQDLSSEKELTRLQIQNQLATSTMGGVLPEQSGLKMLQRVLDVGCGTGAWLIEVAKSYPTMPLLIGIDVNDKMIEYARGKAKAELVDDRVEFQTLDALSVLEFPLDFFDLVNIRFGMSFLRTRDWPQLLQDLQRITRPDGVIRVTEGDLGTSNSVALTYLMDLLLQAFYQAGYFFTPSRDGVTSKLEHLFQQCGLQNVQAHGYPLKYCPGTADWQQSFDNTKLLFRAIVPFLRKWVNVPDDYEAIYQQALIDMQQPDFVLRSRLLTVCGNRKVE